MAHNLYLFDLPVELLDSLRPRELALPADHPLRAFEQRPTAKRRASNTPDDEAVAKEKGKYYCAVTGASFDTLEQLREHYKTDWYRYNLKLKSQGKPAGVSEEQFNALVEGLSDSLSGTDTLSEDEDDEDQDSTDDDLSRVLAKQSVSEPVEESNEEESKVARTALLWFEAEQYKPSTQFGLYRAALPALPKKAQSSSSSSSASEEGERAIAILRAVQITPKSDPAERTWTLLMFGGGHFAGMVVSLVPKLVSRGKGKEKERQVVVLESKTFHRYTTRRKQGGGQGANDAANGKAKSAGAQIRRYNEAMLAEEVQSILRAWSDLVRKSELVFLRASKSNNRLFYDFEGSPLTRGDHRIRGFSFPTRRPTLAELTRSFLELTRVKVTHLTAEELAQMDEEYLSSIKKRTATAPSSTQPAPQAKAAAPKMTKEELVERDRWERLVDMVKKGRVEAVDAFLDKHAPASGWHRLPAWMASSADKTPTLLHVASAADQPEMVRYLLVQQRADPTLSASRVVVTTTDDDDHGDDHRAMAQTPYELAPSRATRNVFRFVAGEHGDWWDWFSTTKGGARVPSALTEEQEEQREAKGKERRNKLRDKLKERDSARRKQAQAEEEEEEEREAREEREAAVLLESERLKTVKSKGPQRLGGPGASATPPAGNALTDEQRARLMREQRARAAEARLRPQ